MVRKLRDQQRSGQSPRRAALVIRWGQETAGDEILDGCGFDIPGKEERRVAGHAMSIRRGRLGGLFGRDSDDLRGVVVGAESLACGRVEPVDTQRSEPPSVAANADVDGYTVLRR
jgi:hypothetical protein